MHENDIVLTGSPRSGTTLAAYLLSKVENTVSLSEAIRPGRLGRFRDDPEAAAEGVERFYETARQQITDERVAPTKVVNGRQSFETYEAPDERGERREMVEFGEVPVEKPLGNDFRLSIKSPTLFTAILPALVKRFDCYAIVRNPLAVLASRNSLSSGRPPREYRPPTALLFDAEQAQRMEEFEPRSLDWQLEMLRWACERYATYLSADNIIRYEDIVDTGGAALASVVPAAAKLSKAEGSLENKNLSDIYNRSFMQEAGERLLRSGGPWWRFYSPTEVEALL